MKLIGENEINNKEAVNRSSRNLPAQLILIEETHYVFQTNIGPKRVCRAFHH